MKNKKIITGCIVLFAIVSVSSVHNVHGQVRAGAAFLKILPGARQQGFAGSTTALIDETYAFYANPGAIGFLREHQWGLTYTKWITDIYNISLNFSRPIRTPLSRRTGISLGINYQGIKEFDSSRGATPPASANDILLTGGLGFPVSFISKNLSIGTNLKYFRNELDQFSAYSVMMDYGALFRTNRFELFGGNGEGLFRYGIFSIGAAVSHIGLRMRHISEWTPLPRTYRTGAAFYTGSHTGLQLQISADYRAIADEVSSFGMGAELSWRRRIAFRGGYLFNDRMLSKYSFGLSIRLDDVQSDLNTKIAGKNNALGFDFVTLENNDFFSDAYRGGITHIPLGPEKFRFISRPDMEYTSEDTIQLVWEDTRDPDLYDDVFWGFAVTTNKNALNNFITKTENWEIDFSEGFEDAIAFDILQQTLQKNEENNTYFTRLLPLNSGHYYWTVWAYDKDRHIRFAESDNQKIRHFRVIQKSAPPDTAADVIITKHLNAAPVRLDIHFAFDIDTLDYHSREQLNMLGVALKSPEFRKLNVELGGHTDERGSDAYNMALSQRRVNSAMTFLVEESGVSQKRVTAVGYGESRPIYPNTTIEAEHAANRRVELTFIEPVGNAAPPKIVLYRQQINYELKIENRSGNPARNIKIVDILPDTLHAVNFSLKPTFSGDSLVWTIPVLKAGQTVSITYSGTAPGFVNANPLRLENNARVYAANDTIPDNNRSRQRVYVIGAPDSVIYMDSNTIALSDLEKSALMTWAEYLKTSPYVDLCIEGHTDLFPTEEENKRFSDQKAEEAKAFLSDWLVNNAGAFNPILKIYAKGWGSSYPNQKGANNNRLVIHMSPCR